jgi:hypothetical protein
MAATVQSVSTTAFATSSSVTITKPTGVSVGDLLIAQISIVLDTDTISTLSGWTHVISNQPAGPTKTSIQWKIADSSDAAASNFTFNASGVGTIGGAMIRIDGFVTPPSLNYSAIRVVNNNNPSFANTVTPTAINSLLLFFVFGNENGSVGSYAIATSNPTWIEHYDFGYEASGLMACASATRSAMTATGNSSVLISGASGNIDPYGIMIAIDTPANATATPEVMAGTLSIPMPVSPTGTATATPEVIAGTLSIQPTTATSLEPMWSNEQKNSTTWINETKS